MNVLWGTTVITVITANNSGIYSLLGGVGGLVIGLLVIVTFVRKDHSIKAQYDERQLLIRGKAYKYGFITMAVVNFFLCILEKCDTNLLYLSAMLGIGVVCFYNIIHDAYLALNERYLSTAVILLILSVMNVLIGGFMKMSFSECFPSFVVGSECFIISVVLFFKYFTSKEGHADEES